MMTKKKSKKDFKKAIFGIFFAIMGIFAGLATPVIGFNNVYADENDDQTSEVVDDNSNFTGEEIDEVDEVDDNDEKQDKEEVDSNDEEQDENKVDTGDKCQASLGAIGWQVCPSTDKVAGAVDWLFERLQGILEINPVSAEDGSPIYEIWKYCLSLTNIVFAIFLLVVVYSQITGYGITNYGIKKVLPKIIVTAILVNLSFLICSLAVDISNILGNSIRGLFNAVQETVIANEDIANVTQLSFSGVFGAFASGTTLAVGTAAVIAFELGAIWMLIPVVLGAIVSVVTGLITVALRQAVVVLLIMIAPLAIVAYILPNTEQWFRKWKQLFMKMLVFYPMFSLLFGASSLAGFAIIASATDGFGVLLGMAVQIFPLFFSWKLMRMSGTFLETINSRMRGLADGPLAKNRAWAESHQQLSKQKHLAGRAHMPSMKLMQFMSNRKVAREAEISEHQETIKNRGLAYKANRNYNEKGVPTRRAERAYAEQADNTKYQRDITRDKNNFNKGLAYLAIGTKKEDRLKKLDKRNVDESDLLKAEQARTETIEYENAVSFRKRMEEAVNAHIDMQEGFEYKIDEDGKFAFGKRSDYRFHSDPNKLATSEGMARYNAISKVMEGNAANVQYVAATAAHGYDTQKKIIETKMQKYFELTPPSKDVNYRLSEFTNSKAAIDNIDSIISGLRILNQRGDTDLVREQLKNVLNQGVELGTHASQSIASFLMFDVKDSDPLLRRFGKYINIETAHAYNENKRKNGKVTLNEYITGEYDEIDPETGIVIGKEKSKKPMQVLLEGTSFDNIERTAMKNIDDSIMEACRDKDGNLDMQKYLDLRDKVETAIGPQFISASLKHLSGSEQLKSMVSFLTGYNSDGKARWEDDGDLAGDDARKAEEYFRNKTMKYLGDQTPGQILGLRSDYYNPLSEHLFKEYKENEMEGWSEEAKQERLGYMNELSDIQTRYSDLPAEQAQKRRAEDMKNLKEKMIGAQFRQLLDSKGKLAQIYRTRRSGVANNAKDWLRGWLNLDDEAAIAKELKNINDRRETEKRTKGEADSLDDSRVELSGGFNQSDRDFYVAGVRDVWDNWHISDGDDVDRFFDDSEEYVRSNLGGVSDGIIKKYDDYYSDHPNASARELMEKLIELLQDPNNY